MPLPPNPHRRPPLRGLTAAAAAAALVAVPIGSAAGSEATAPTAIPAPQGSSAPALTPTPATAPAVGGSGSSSSVREVPVPGIDAGAARALLRTEPSTRSGVERPRDVVALSPAVPAIGYAAVGLTWAPGGAVAGQEFEVRTRTDGAWSGWQEAHADVEHGPTPGSAEAQGATPGTDPVVVGDVDAVQVRATADRPIAPSGLTLSVVDPGQPTPTPPSAVRTAAPAYPAAKSAGTAGKRPAIYSRAQWGADESLRSGFTGYGEIQGSFVHHTVNANDYTRAEVPSILRGIYAYHTQSRGWSDVGYNFLVDRFGRVWEGRWGGVTKPVIGAHTLGYNEEAFAMSAIGNFEEVAPSKAMLAAYGRLLGWKLGLHGIDPQSRVLIDGDPFHAVNGHRDAAATACPGTYLYGRLPTIRKRAAAAQAVPVERRLQRSVVSNPRPDLLVRRGGAMRVLAGDPGPGFRPPVGSRTDWADARSLTGLGDLTGDGTGDVLVVTARGRATTVPGAGDNTFGSAVPVGRRFAAADLVVGSGDLSGDDVPDVVHRDAAGTLWLSPGRRDGTLATARVLSDDYPTARSVTPAGDADSDGDHDLVVMTAADRLLLVPGDGDGDVGTPTVLFGGWPGRTVLTGGFDVTGDARPDLLVRGTAGGRTWIRPGLGDGTYGAALGGFTGWERVRASLLGDADGDGRVDALVRRPSGRVLVAAGRGGAWLHPATRLRSDWSGYRWAQIVGDWDGDGDDDVLGVRDGRTWLHPGRGKGQFGAAVGGWDGLERRSRITAVGDWDGDGRPDLVSRSRDGAAWVHPGRGRAGFGAAYEIRGTIFAPTAMLGVGPWDRGATPDLMTRTGRGSLLLWPGDGRGGLGDPVRIATGADRYDKLIGIGDLDRDGHPDLVGRLARNGQLFLLPGRPDGLAAPVPIGSGPQRGNLLG